MPAPKFVPAYLSVGLTFEFVSWFVGARYFAD